LAVRELHSFAALREDDMPIRTFTFYHLGRDLDHVAPGFGLTVDYDILESLIETLASSRPPCHLKDELRQLAEEHHCDFKDWSEHRFVQFVKRMH
jgi:hypothetical protein